VAQSFERPLLESEVGPFVERYRAIDLIILESQVVSNLHIGR
jgi:hypothetical protein